MREVIKVKNLTKKYKKSSETAVEDISFSVNEGEFFTFLGPNGAGKTTTISILTTTLAKTSGTVEINGLDVDNSPGKVREMIGIIFQNQSLDLNLTAEENIRFHAVLFGEFGFSPTYSLMPRAYKNKVNELAELVGISKDIHKPVKTFSGGMKRKLEIVRSLMHEPRVLFLDEPTTGLDPASRRSVWNYLNEVKKTKNTTIFLTTHYLEEAEESDNVCIISNGKIVAQGTPGELKEQLVEKYILMDSNDKTSLLGELKALKLDFEEEDLIKIKMNGLDAQKIIQSIKTPLKKLDIHIPTLEDAYLEIIKNEELNNGK